MKRLSIMGALACLVALMAPAMAANGESYRAHHAYRMYRSPAIIHGMTAQDYDHFDFGIARPAYHSGWGGPYHDGDYPGTIDQNMGPPYWAY